MKRSAYLLKKQWIYLSSVCLLFLTLLFCSPDLSAQGREIILSKEPKTILEAFEEIEKQTGMKIAYTETVIDIQQIIEVSATGKSLSEAMDAILRKTNTIYRIQATGSSLLQLPNKPPISNTPG